MEGFGKFVRAIGFIILFILLGISVIGFFVWLKDDGVVQ